MIKKLLLLLIAIPFFLYTYPAVSFAEESHIQDEIIYNVFVDRFNNGDQAFSDQVRLDDPYAYHGGDLQGIIMKLDDLKKLGFTTISLSPIMENAANGYHGYWVEDFYQVEKDFGTLEDLQTLVQEAHTRDMKVVMELVTNYVAKTNPIVDDPDKKDWILPNAKVDSSNEPWLENVAVLNQENPEVQDMLIDMAKYWLQESNVDGFVLHAADQSNADFIQRLTNELKTENPDLYLIANVLSDEAQDSLVKISTLDAVENPALSQKIIDVFTHADNPVVSLFDTWQEIGSKKDLIYVDDETMERFAQRAIENGRDDVNTWKLALIYMLTSPGVTSVFQGSEIPMYGASMEDTQRLVDFNSGDPDIKEVFTRVIALRTNFPVLQYGNFEVVGSDHGMSIFKRSYQDQSIYIAINNDSQSRDVSVTDLNSGLQLRGLLGDNLVRQQDNGEFNISVPRESADVFIVEEDSGLNWLFIIPVVVILMLFIGVVVHLNRKQKKKEAK